MRIAAAIPGYCSQSNRPSKYEHTHELSEETYDAEKTFEIIWGQQKHRSDEEALPELRSDADSVA